MNVLQVVRVNGHELGFIAPCPINDFTPDFCVLLNTVNVVVVRRFPIPDSTTTRPNTVLSHCEMFLFSNTPPQRIFYFISGFLWFAPVFNIFGLSLFLLTRIKMTMTSNRTERKRKGFSVKKLVRSEIQISSRQCHLPENIVLHFTPGLFLFVLELKYKTRSF